MGSRHPARRPAGDLVRTYQVVTFDREECSLLSNVVPSLSIAYPEGAWDEPEPRAVRALAGRTDATHELLIRAEAALVRQRDICEEQSTAEYDAVRALALVRIALRQTTPRPIREPA